MDTNKTNSNDSFTLNECFADAKAINLKLQLRGTKSVRVVTLPGNMRLYWLAEVIMNCFGFDRSHLYHFEDSRFNVVEKEYGLLAVIRNRMNERNRMCREISIMHKSIEDVFPEYKERAYFFYDYGDDWEVQITRMADAKNAKLFECKKSVGMNAIENIGGCWRLEWAREVGEKILADPKELEKLDDDDRSFLGWIVGDDDEEKLVENLRETLATPSVKAINKILRKCNGEFALKGKVPFFYSNLEEADDLRDISWDDYEVEEDESDEDIINRIMEHIPYRNETPPIGRNDLCPCGSGKKYKKCCGRS